MGILDLIGLGKGKQEFQAMVEEGAVILDVRTKREYSGGHIKGSKNIPLDQLQSRLSEVKAFGTPVITCCASGMRSGSAASMLCKNGVDAMNGGGWMSLSSRLG